jgi:lysyl-tRNA synthetase class 2
MIVETCDFIRLFLGNIPSEQITYKDAFSRYLHCNYTTADLLALAKAHGASADARSWDRDTLLQYLMSLAIEPHLGKDSLLALTHFPASQSALAKTAMHGEEAVSYRFEIFYNGIELANGYHELTDPVEQRQRFETANAVRTQEGKQALAIDEKFLASLSRLPDCCGVAVGFDRLMLLRHQRTCLSHILPISWDKL